MAADSSRIPESSYKTAPPVAVHVTRGDMIESRHRASFAVVDAEGRTVAAVGEIDAPVYPRSAIKPLQALPVVETGAADRFAMTGPELALACASHGGEPEHVATAAGVLARAGLSVADLACGAHLPYHVPSAHALIRAGEAPSALHNNCSGKHAAMLATVVHMSEAVRAYVAPEHPAQRRITRVYEEMCGVDLARAPRGTDGCSLPQIGIPLSALARGMARFGAPDDLPPARAAACRRLAEAMVRHPMMIAGSGRFCTAMTEIAAGKAVLKTGAEGMFMAAVPARGIGIAIKVEDGAARAAEVALAALLARYADFDSGQLAKLEALMNPPLTNVAGLRIGQLAPNPNF